MSLAFDILHEWAGPGSHMGSFVARYIYIYSDLRSVMYIWYVIYIFSLFLCSPPLTSCFPFFSAL